MFFICCVAVQILYNGHLHWVATAYINGTVYLYDSLAGDRLPSKLEEMIAMIYQDAVRDNGLVVTRVPVSCTATEGQHRLWTLCHCICLPCCSRRSAHQAMFWAKQDAPTSLGVFRTAETDCISTDIREDQEEQKKASLHSTLLQMLATRKLRQTNGPVWFLQAVVSL